MIEKGIPKHMGIVVLVGVISVLSPSFQFQPVRRLIFHLYVCAGILRGYGFLDCSDFFFCQDVDAFQLPVLVLERKSVV